MTARVLYIEFKKTEIGPALNKVCQRAFALQLQKQGPRPRSAIKANGHTTAASSSSAAATDASTASSSSTALARDKKGAPLTAQQVMSAIEAQFAVASSSTAASIVSADTPLSSSLTRSRRLSCDDIILKTSGRASNSALQELKANIAAAAIASGVPNIQSTSSASSTESLDRTSEPLAAPHLSLSPRTNTPHVTPPIATSSSAPVQPVSTSSSSSTSNIASKLVVPQDLERDPAKIKERERVRRKLKRGLKSKLRASHCYVPPTPELIASVTIAPPARNIEPGNFPDPGTRQLSIALARLSCISLSYLVSRISYLVSRIYILCLLAFIVISAAAVRARSETETISSRRRRRGGFLVGFLFLDRCCCHTAQYYLPVYLSPVGVHSVNTTSHCVLFIASSGRDSELLDPRRSTRNLAQVDQDRLRVRVSAAPRPCSLAASSERTNHPCVYFVPQPLRCCALGCHTLWD